MAEPSFVITGTGRSGTRYCAGLLTFAGLRCGHEAYWNPFGTQDPDLDGDSSWCAAPYLGGYEGRIVHVVRDPLAVVNSLVKSPDLGAAAEFRRRVLHVWSSDPVREAIDTVLRWREMCDRLPVYLRCRLDDIGEEFVEALGGTDAASALEQAESERNWHGYSRWEMGWDDLPADGQTQALHRLAERDGFV